ncbi:hypothetical protein [Bradyrhizobium quebecense]|uniref:Uncharacterized protein n=2 Tax=Bradyrhizobium quebecense TaxID=2748629 RepID=A0ACD3VM54_9BRAD|nr:hypothetical protein [Bradyrhizobium quebecense]UGY07435.1 hypothetical protein J4P68_0040385 [Bradyrhizobium quebecense]
MQVGRELAPNKIDELFSRVLRHAISFGKLSKQSAIELLDRLQANGIKRLICGG